MSLAYSWKHCLHRFRWYFLISPCLQVFASDKSSRQDLSITNIGQFVHTHCCKPCTFWSLLQTSAASSTRYCRDPFRLCNNERSSLDQNKRPIYHTHRGGLSFRRKDLQFSDTGTFDHTFIMLSFLDTLFVPPGSPNSLSPPPRGAAVLDLHQHWILSLRFNWRQ